MNFLTFYALATNFLLFWGVSLVMLFHFIAVGENGGAYVALLIVMVVGAAVLSLLPFVAPLLTTAAIGFFTLRASDGVWILEFIGAALFFGSLGILAFANQITIDHQKARYWRHLWTTKTHVEDRIGPIAPYIELDEDRDWRLLFFPVLAPFLYLGLAMKADQTDRDTESEK